jgi:NADH pyrophosphatase NudC (nudix superfamily)
MKKGKLIQKRERAKNPEDFYKYDCSCGGKPKYVESEWKWKCSKCGANNYE